MSKPRVFISYSHKDEQWKNQLASQLNVLAGEGILDTWDDRRIEAGGQWYAEIEKAINQASAAVLIISADFLNSPFIRKEEIPRLLKRREEEGIKIFPLITRHCPWQAVQWLSPIQARPTDGKPLSDMSKTKREEALSEFAKEIADILARGTTIEKDGRIKSTILPEHVATGKMPVTDNALFGRKADLEWLDSAWKDPKVNIISIVAIGGVGKTALINRWLNDMAQEGYRGAERVYAWSFYSQGAEVGRQVSADFFIDAALRWFADSAPEKGSPWEKGERLANLVRRHKTLLVLDGLEPLQNPPGHNEGGIKDVALRELLKELAMRNPGLCVISTRIPVNDLMNRCNATVLERELLHLTEEAGAQILQNLGVKGTQQQLRDAVREYGGHSLALVLLGNYLRIVHTGDINQRVKIPTILKERKQGDHARRVMLAYERWFAGKLEERILFALGFFDRPAPFKALAQAMEAVKGQALGKTGQSFEIAPVDPESEEFRYAIDALRQARLVEESKDILDCHPLVREHFGERLKELNPEQFRKGHRLLYDHFKDTAKEFPDTVEEMAPLYAAVRHGCLAGIHQEALDDVYWKRILRGKEAFSIYKLGAFGADLSAIAGLFDPPWKRPADGLKEGDKAFILSQAGFCLRALGRLSEAAEPMEAGLEAAIEQKDWKNAAIRASNLSELYLTMGTISKSREFAKKGVDLADKSGDAFQRMGKRTTLADCLHQAGSLTEAEGLFVEAEAMQKERQPGYTLLYSLQGFRYCDLLLGQGRYQEVKGRAGRTLEWVRRVNWLLDIALDHLSLGRADLLETAASGKGDYTEAEARLNHAVNGLREAGAQHHLPRGLLARAALYRQKKELDRAGADLTEAFTISEQGGMRLHLADCLLERARLCLARGDKANDRESLDTARTMIDEMGYHRRDGEVMHCQNYLFSL